MTDLHQVSKAGTLQFFNKNLLEWLIKVRLTLQIDTKTAKTSSMIKLNITELTELNKSNKFMDGVDLKDLKEGKDKVWL